MTNRLDKERQERLEPQRLEAAKQAIQEKGYTVVELSNTTISFEFKNCLVLFYPYSGWATGKTIKDGRGLKNLLNQI